MTRREFATSSRTTMRMRPNLSEPTAPGERLFRHDVRAAVGEEHNEIHHYKHEVVVPAICFLTPKSGMPDKDFVVYRSQQHNDES